MTGKLPEAYISFPPLHFPVSRLTHSVTCESAEFDTTSLWTETLTLGVNTKRQLCPLLSEDVRMKRTLVEKSS